MKIAMAGFSAAPSRTQQNHSTWKATMRKLLLVFMFLGASGNYGRHRAGFGSNNLFQQIQNLPARMPPR